MTPSKRRVRRVIKRLGYIKLNGKEITHCEVMASDTVHLSSWGDSIPCKITITYSI